METCIDLKYNYNAHFWRVVHGGSKLVAVASVVVHILQVECVEHLVRENGHTVLVCRWVRATSLVQLRVRFAVAL